MQNSSWMTSIFAVVVLLTAACGDSGWIRQFGTSDSDSFTGATGISVGPLGVFVTGGTSGTLPGQQRAGSTDVFVRKYDAEGNEVWTRQFGSSNLDIARGISLDSTGVYVAGQTRGALPGQTGAGGDDAFVRKYDADGNEVWTLQFGSSENDIAGAISVDSTGVYVVGYMNLHFKPVPAGDQVAFVRKYDTHGNEVWRREIATSIKSQTRLNTVPDGIVVDSTGVYVAGTTSGTLPGQTSNGGQDAYVRKYDADGTEVWTRQFGTSLTTEAIGISVDSTGVYVAGATFGTLPGQTSKGGQDAFLRKYDADGTEVWTRQFGTPDAGSTSYPDPEAVRAISVGSTGVYVLGTTVGTLPGQTSSGGRDAFVGKYDADGNEVWIRQSGTSGDDSAGGIFVDSTGVYEVGRRGQDAFIRKYDANGN